MKILCKYKNGTAKEFPEEFYNIVQNIVKATKKKKGITYAKFLESNLSKVYIDGKLVLDRELVLKQEVEK